MPNWCSNNLKIEGDKKQLQEFKRKVRTKNTDLSLNKLFPIPKELENTDSPEKEPNKILKKKYGYSNWYDWKVANWGCKWDVDAVLQNEDISRKGKIGYLEYSFESPWSPPVEWLDKISGQFKKLTFTLEYKEEGMDFMGRAVATKGELVEDNCI